MKITIYFTSLQLEGTVRQTNAFMFIYTNKDLNVLMFYSYKTQYKINKEQFAILNLLNTFHLRMSNYNPICTWIILHFYLVE